MSDRSTNLLKDGDDTTSAEYTGAEAKAASDASSSSSSIGWNPQWDDDGSNEENGSEDSNIEEENSESADRKSTDLNFSRKRDHSKTSSLGTPSDENQSNKFVGTSNFAALENQSYGSGSNVKERKRCKLEEIEEIKPSLLENLPATIQVPLSLKKDHIKIKTDSCNVSENGSEGDENSSASSQSSPFMNLHPPDKIRHEPLGAPTLVYRHAPSYRDPSQRPSTITPQQLSLALYCNAYPISEWFAEPTGNNVGRSKGGNPTDSLLSPTYIPQHPKPWGRPHEWDWRHDQKNAKQESRLDTNTADDSRRFAEFDANRLVDDFHCSNKAKFRKHWGQIERATIFQDVINHDESSCSSDSHNSNASAPPKEHFFQHRGYKLFRAHCTLNKGDTKLSQREIMDAWRNLPSAEKRRYSYRGMPSYSGSSNQRVFRSKLNSQIICSRYGNLETKEIMKLTQNAWQSLSKEDADHYKILAKQQGILNEENINCNSSGAQHRSQFVPFEKLHMNKQEIIDLLQKERIKWLEWKLHQWDRHDKERAVRKDVLKDYYLQREVKKMVKAWQNEDKVKKRKSENDQSDVAIDDDVGEKPTDIVADSGKSHQLLLLPTSTPVVSENVLFKPNQNILNRKNCDHANNAELDASKMSHSTQAAGLTCRKSIASSSSSSTLSSASSVSSSTLSSSTSSFYTYYTLESQFYDWEEHIAEKVEAFSSSDESKSIGSDVLGDSSDGEFCSIENIAEEIRAWKERQISNVSDLASSEGFKKRGAIDSQQIEKQRMQAFNSKDKLDSSVEYMAPLRREDVGFCFRLNRPMQEKPFENVEDRNSVGGPSAYGNCLVLFPCTCIDCSVSNQQCPTISEKGRDEGLETYSWFMLHPSGESFSCVTISSVRLPRDNLGSSNSSIYDDTSSEIDVGGRILQLSQCDDLCVVARTPLFCSVIRAKLKLLPQENPSATNRRKCNATYDLRQQYRIDLRSPAVSTQPSYLPIFVACNPKNIAASFSRPSFTILNRDLLSGENTVMHRVTLFQDEPIVKKHDFSSLLADVSLVEQDQSDRFGLWAAARHNIMPKLTPGCVPSRHSAVTGYGHSLFRINLRDDSAALVWSPSHEEYMTEGLHSIDGIKSDSSENHILWVSSSSACKVWALDVRYKAAKVVVTWSLPSLCDDLGANFNVSGLFGSGTMFNQTVPINIQRDRQKPLSMFSLKKTPGSSVLGLHYFPSSFPRFQTQPLESAGFQDLPASHCSMSSIARSGSFALPDVSERLFYVGVASMRCPSGTALRKRDLLQLGYDVPPAYITYVLTMTSMGDIFCHSLLECNAAEERRARAYDGLPVGFSSLPLTKQALRGQNHCNNSKELKISLKNEFPCPSDALVPFDAHGSAGPSFRAFSGSNIIAEKTIDSTRNKLCSAGRNPTSLFDLKLSPKSEIESDEGRIKVFQVGCPDDESADPLESNFNASSATNNIKWTRPPAEVSHPTNTFGLSLSNAESRLTLPSHHSVIAMRESNADTLRFDEGSVAEPEPDTTKEVTSELVNRLKSNYYSNNSEIIAQTFKSEWSVSSNDSYSISGNSSKFE